jgi:hypothetical protein
VHPSPSAGTPDPVDHQQGNVGDLRLQISHEVAADLGRQKFLTFLIILKLGKYIGFNICEQVLKDLVNIMQGS